MKLYVTHLGRWAGTQVDIKPLGKEDGGWVEREVPTDKAGLIAWLNGYREAVLAELAPLGHIQPEPQPLADEDISDLLGEDEPATTPVTAPPALTPHKVVDWLLDTATPAQVETVFAALGARFHEAVKGKTND